MGAFILFLLLLLALILTLRRDFKRGNSKDALTSANRVSIQHGETTKENFDRHLKKEEKGESSAQLGNLENLPIKEIEKRLDKEEIDYSFSLLELIRQCRKQRRKNDKIKKLLVDNKHVKDDIYHTLMDLEIQGDMVLEVEIDEIDDPNNEFYKSLKEQTLKKCKLAIKEFEEISEKLEKAYLNQQNVEKVKREKELDNELSNLSKSDNLDSDEWSKIEEKHLEIKEGYLYALSNPSMPGLLKIGFSKNSPKLRALELSTSTSIPAPFKVEGFWKVKVPFLVEQMLHKELEDFRYGKEFFKVEIGTLMSIIETKYKEHLLEKDQSQID